MNLITKQGRRMIAPIVLGQDVGGPARRMRQGLAAEVTADDRHLADGDRKGPPTGP